MKQAKQTQPRILRYDLGHMVEVHEGAILLDVQPNSKGGLDAWLLTDTSNPKEKRGYMSFQTGKDLPADVWDARHVRTIKTGGGAMHIFEFTEAQMKGLKIGE